MIFIKRFKEPLVSNDLILEKNRLLKHLEHLKEVEKSVNSFEFIASRTFKPKSIKELDPLWFSKVIEQCNGKCVYCESKILSERTSIDYYRPINGVAEENINNSNFLVNHYYVWLAYEWENLVLSCNACNSNKKNYFPVEGSRVKFDGNVDLEKNLLINPFSDSPQDHLYFNADGRVVAKSSKGEHTIELLRLNSPDLVKKRQYEANRLIDFITTKDYRSIEYLLGADMDYLGVKKTVLAELLLNKDLNNLNSFLHSPSLKQTFKRLFGNYKNQKELKESMDKYSDNYRVNNLSGIRYKNHQINTIEISNLRGLNLIYHFKEGSNETPWLVLLGENGSGKTSILQLITLALAEKWKGIKVDSEAYCSPNQEGHVIIRYSNSETPSILRFSAGDISQDSSIKIPVVAYGANRLLPKHPQRDKSIFDGINIKNLFPSRVGDYFMVHPNSWIKEEHSISLISKVVLEVLPLDDEDTVDLIIEKGKAQLVLNGSKFHLYELSSGFQNIIALVTDIMRTIGSIDRKNHFSQGVVLIDEIDTHLHPSWKLVIVEKLKKVFPYIQFIISTHDPLCLRGVREEEILVLKRTNEDIQVINHPDPKGLGIDEILTSSMFGLFSTYDSEVEETIKKYYQYLNKDSKSEEDLYILNNIRKRLEQSDIKYLGYTNREKLMYQVVDEYIARKKTQRKSYNKLDKESEKRLIEIWNLEDEEYL